MKVAAMSLPSMERSCYLPFMLYLYTSCFLGLLGTNHWISIFWSQSGENCSLVPFLKVVALCVFSKDGCVINGCKECNKVEFTGTVTCWDCLWCTEANQNWSVCIQTMIEAHVDVKTTDGYLLRLFCVGFTKKRTNQIRKTSYAQHQQVRQIRKKMMEIMTREVQTNDLKEVVNKL